MSAVHRRMYTLRRTTPAMLFGVVVLVGFFSEVWHQYGAVVYEACTIRDLGYRYVQQYQSDLVTMRLVECGVVLPTLIPVANE